VLIQFFKVFLIILFLAYFWLLVSIFLRRLWSAPAGELETDERLPEPEVKSPVPLIEVINVRKSFDHPVLNGVFLRVARGETVGVLGRSGEGKSVLLKLIAGFLKPDSGLILYQGTDITRFSENQLLEFRKRVSYVFQSGAFFDFLDVRENIAYPLRERRAYSEAEINKRVDYLLDAVELEGMGSLRYDELSVGAKKQVAIARSIAIAPEVILYDEPTTGVDPIIGKSLSRLIRKLGTQESLTSVVVTHDLKCLEIVSDKLVILKSGTIRFQGDVEEFSRSEDPFVVAFRTGKRFDEDEDQALLTA
jgi:phospholipid/cholesterol/gamma-HCH transport system ATP-binding protein